MPNLVDISGQRFGTLTVQGRAPGTADARSAWWSVACDCGAELSRRGDLLRGGKTKCPKCSAGHPGRIYPVTLGTSLRETLELNSEFITECGCQIWTSSLDGHGYGRLRIAGRSQRAHRLSWITTNGPIPLGLHILHRCDVPPCINPDHLFPGTAADNIADMMRKGRHAAQRRHF